MVGMALVFVVAEVTPLFLVTCFTIIAADLDALDRVSKFKPIRDWSQ